MITPNQRKIPMTQETQAPQTPPENFNIRCPRLGHQINFVYCRSENSGLPCFKTLDCWYTYFDVQAWLQAHLPPEEFKRVFQSHTKPKILSLLDLIEQAKADKAKDDKGETS